MASIDARNKVVQESTVRQYARLLDGLDRKCKENRTQIADFAAKGVQLLAEKKVEMTHLKFLQSMDGAMPEGSEALEISCAEIAALLVTMIDRR